MERISHIPFILGENISKYLWLEKISHIPFILGENISKYLWLEKISHVPFILGENISKYLWLGENFSIYLSFGKNLSNSFLLVRLLISNTYLSFFGLLSSIKARGGWILCSYCFLFAKDLKSASRLEAFFLLHGFSSSSSPSPLA